MVSDGDVMDSTWENGMPRKKYLSVLVEVLEIHCILEGGEQSCGHSYSSQRRESVCSVHPLIMNLVLGLTRLGLPCLANLPTLLREDIIVAGGNSVILSRLGKTQRKGKNLQDDIR